MCELQFPTNEAAYQLISAIGYGASGLVWKAQITDGPQTGVNNIIWLFQSSYKRSKAKLQAPVTYVAPVDKKQEKKKKKKQIKSKIEYIPYERYETEYQAQTYTEQVPIQKKVVDYYAVEHQTEYIPQVEYQTYIEYVPQERVVQNVSYQAVQKSIQHPGVVSSQVQQSAVQASQATYDAAPMTYAAAPMTYAAAPLTSSYNMPGTTYAQPYGRTFI